MLKKIRVDVTTTVHKAILLLLWPCGFTSAIARCYQDRICPRHYRFLTHTSQLIYDRNIRHHITEGNYFIRQLSMAASSYRYCTYFCRYDRTDTHVRLSIWPDYDLCDVSGFASRRQPNIRLFPNYQDRLWSSSNLQIRAHRGGGGGGKAKGHEAYHSPPFGADVKNAFPCSFMARAYRTLCKISNQ